MWNPGPGDALLVVDVQNDFMPGGALGIARGDEVLAPINRLIDAWRARSLPVFFSRDWHPADHCSFLPRGGPWPTHCVQHTPGAAFRSGLHLPEHPQIVSKATQRDQEAYSALQGTDLRARLCAAGARRIFICGLATDYCVLATGEDALATGLGVVVLTDAVRGVDAQPGDAGRALERLAAAGAVLTTSERVLDEPGPP